MKIVVLDAGSLPPATTLRRPGLPHSWQAFESSTAADLPSRMAEAQVVVSGKVRLDAEVLAMAPALRLVAVPGTGVDHVDLQACARRGIAVTHVPDYAEVSVPEHTIALMLCLRRSLLAYRNAVRDGAWERAGRFYFLDAPIRDLAGTTLGLVGSGRLGLAVAGMARALGMRVLFAGRKGAAGVVPGHVPFTDVLMAADVISLHCPLTPQTHHLFGAAEFAAMARRRPLFINTARGGLVDEVALVQALQMGQLSGAGLDVASAEPPGPAHPLRALLGRPDFILTPHVAWASEQARARLAESLISYIEAFAQGLPFPTPATPR